MQHKVGGEVERDQWIRNHIQWTITFYRPVIACEDSSKLTHSISETTQGLVKLLGIKYSYLLSHRASPLLLGRRMWKNNLSFLSPCFFLPFLPTFSPVCLCAGGNRNRLPSVCACVCVCGTQPLAHRSRLAAWLSASPRGWSSRVCCRSSWARGRGPRSCCADAPQTENRISVGGKRKKYRQSQTTAQKKQTAPFDDNNREIASSANKPSGGCYHVSLWFSINAETACLARIVIYGFRKLCRWRILPIPLFWSRAPRNNTVAWSAQNFAQTKHFICMKNTLLGYLAPGGQPQSVVMTSLTMGCVTA